MVQFISPFYASIDMEMRVWYNLEKCKREEVKMNLEALQDAIEDVNRSSEISYATLSTISAQRDNEIVSWAIAGVMDQIEKIKGCLTIINGVLTKEELCNEF